MDVIVRAGAFSSPIALYLIRKYLSAYIVLVDRSPFPSQVGSERYGKGIRNKVIRTDYTNQLHMKLAPEAMEL